MRTLADSNTSNNQAPRTTDKTLRSSIVLDQVRRFLRNRINARYFVVTEMAQENTRIHNPQTLVQNQSHGARCSHRWYSITT